MKKEFVFSAKFDTSEFDKSVEMMQRKLKDIMTPIAGMQNATAQRMGAAGMGGMMSGPGTEAYQRATQQSRREMDQMIAEQARGQERLGKIIAQRSETLKKLQDQQKQLTKDSLEELQIKERIARVEATNQQMRETYRQRDAMLNQSLDARESMRPKGMEAIVQGYQGGGFRGAARAGMGQIGIGGVGSALGTIGMIGERGAEIYRDFNRGPVRTESAMGSAVQGSLGRGVGDIYGRRTAFEQMFAPERQRAAQQSLDSMRAAQSADMYGTGFGALKSIGGGMAAGAAVGAGIGALGGPIGSLGGAAIGGGVGLLKGGWDIMSDERKRSMVMSPFSDTAKRRYQSMLAEDMVKDYETSYEGQKRQNPFKTAAVGEYEQNFQRNLMAQRSMGLGNQGFYGSGGFMAGNIGAGFTGEMGLEMANSIQGSGGSTQMMRNAVFGNQLSRGTDLTNAGQVLGTLSGGLGSSESTKQATVKILAEGMKLGLDDSKFAEENRKFAALTAEIVARSGARTGGDMERVAGGFGKFLGENTNLGIGAAKSAYEQYQQISQATTGPRGVMRAAGFMGDPDLNKLSTMTKQALMQVPESDLNVSNPLVQAAAQEAGISAEDVIKKVTGVNQGAVSRFKEADTIRDRLRSGMQAMGKDRLSEEDIATLPEGMKKDFNQLAALQTTELGYQGSRETTARALGTINTGAESATVQGAREGAINERISGGGPGRMEDSTVKAMAADSKVVLDNFNEMAPAMSRAAESAAAWTREVREMNAALQQALEAARTNKGSNDLKALEDLMKRNAGNTGNQPQGGRQSK